MLVAPEARCWFDAERDRSARASIVREKALVRALEGMGAAPDAAPYPEFGPDQCPFPVGTFDSGELPDDHATVE